MQKASMYLRAFAMALVAFLVLGGYAFAQDTGDGTSTPLDSLSDFALWSIVAGSLGTFIVAAINRQTWTSATKFATFFIWCMITAGLTAYFQRTLDFDNWVRSLLLVFASGQAVYVVGKNAIKQVEASTG